MLFIPTVFREFNLKELHGNNPSRCSMEDILKTASVKIKKPFSFKNRNFLKSVPEKQFLVLDERSSSKAKPNMFRVNISELESGPLGHTSVNFQNFRQKIFNEEYNNALKEQSSSQFPYAQESSSCCGLGIPIYNSHLGMIPTAVPTLYKDNQYALQKSHINLVCDPSGVGLIDFGLDNLTELMKDEPPNTTLSNILEFKGNEPEGSEGNRYPEDKSLQIFCDKNISYEFPYKENNSQNNFESLNVSPSNLINKSWEINNLLLKGMEKEKKKSFTPKSLRNSACLTQSLESHDLEFTFNKKKLPPDNKKLDTTSVVLTGIHGNAEVINKKTLLSDCDVKIVHEKNKDLDTASLNLIEMDNKDYSEIATPTNSTLDTQKGNINTKKLKKKVVLPVKNKLSIITRGVKRRAQMQLRSRLKSKVKNNFQHQNFSKEAMRTCRLHCVLVNSRSKAGSSKMLNSRKNIADEPLSNLLTKTKEKRWQLRKNTKDKYSFVKGNNKQPNRSKLKKSTTGQRRLVKKNLRKQRANKTFNKRFEVKP
ncbi:uncharacterized protein LOC135120321 [Zophobas morio]|uniref:uncharacterized protein LOC135120321 n=1 Tax=Zophobas morio TaxID=2755281 RepID=UPI00308385E7